MITPAVIKSPILVIFQEKEPTTSNPCFAKYPGRHRKNQSINQSVLQPESYGLVGFN
jgi:hypothetical protein